jgi:hypothetical protein
LLPLSRSLVSDLLIACDYHCCDILDKIPAVDGVASDDLRTAIWSYRSGVNTRRGFPTGQPSWWRQLESHLDFASAAYWHPFALHPLKKLVNDCAGMQSHSRESVAADSGVRSISSFFQPRDADAPPPSLAAAISLDLSRDKCAPAAAPSIKANSIRSFFPSVSHAEAEDAAAAEIAAAAAAASTTLKTKRTQSGGASSGLKKLFGRVVESRQTRSVAEVFIVED